MPIYNKEVEIIEATSKAISWLSFCQGVLCLLKPPLWKPFLVTQLLMIFQQFTGAAFIHTYTVTIFQQATAALQTDSVILKNPNYAASITTGVYVIGSILSIFVVDRLGRRPLLLASGVGITIALSALGAYYYILSENLAYANQHLFWLPLASLMLYDFGFGIAFGGLPFLIISEIFPLHVRAVATGLGSLNHNICFFIVIKVFASIKSVPPFGVFWIYASVALLSVIFIYFFIPETKGRSLEEIQEMWYPKTDNVNGNNDIIQKMSSRL